MTGFIAVHVGAGLHSQHLWPKYKETCKAACTRAVKLLHNGCDSTTAITAAVSVLEDCPYTNAGIGSHLSLQRTVECDAAIMDGQTLNFGSVGAMPHIKNPIQVAKKLVDVQAERLSCNRVPPNTLVGEGATRWAESRGFVRSNLVTDSSDHAYVKYYKTMLQHEDDVKSYRIKEEENKTYPSVGLVEEVVEEYCGSKSNDSVEIFPPPSKKLKTSGVRTFSEDANLDTEVAEGSEESSSLLEDVTEANQHCPQKATSQQRPPECIRLDTVGAVCVDSSGNVSSAVSSGGICLKNTGRIGQAAAYGAGCWAQNSPSPDKPSIGTSVTGVGEYLTKTLFARECYQAMYEQGNCMTALPDVLVERFIKSPFLKHVTAIKQAGVLLVQHYSEDNRCELGWAHNSKTMVLGYGSTTNKRTHEIVSVLPPQGIVGRTVAGGFKCVRLGS